MLENDPAFGQSCNDETEVELTENFHLFKVRLSNLFGQLCLSSGVVIWSDGRVKTSIILNFISIVCLHPSVDLTLYSFQGKNHLEANFFLCSFGHIIPFNNYFSFHFDREFISTGA